MEKRRCRINTSSRSIKARPVRARSLFDRARRVVAVAQKEFRADLPAAGLGRARPAGDLVDAGRRRSRGADAGRSEPARRSRRSASPTSARRPSSGTARPGEPIYNAIVWQDRRTAAHLRRSRRRATSRMIRAEDRPGDRRVLLGDQDRLDARQRARRARAGPKRASSRSARSIAGSSGSSPAARCTSPT